MTDTVIIGIGRTGCRIVNQIETNYDKMYFDTDKDVIEKYNGVCLNYKATQEYPAMNSYEGELAVVENERLVINAIKEYKNVIIVTFLGGATSNGITKKIVDLCYSLKQNTNVYTSLPFEFERDRRISDAISTFNYICELCSVKRIDNDYHIENGQTMTLADIFKLQDKKMMNLIKENI